jgi:TRAP-type C4-dicarboxylate transport system permease small subunit
LLHYSGSHGGLCILAGYRTLYFNAPSSVLDEFTQILFMWMILLGGVYTAGLKKHLAIDLLAQKLSPPQRAGLTHLFRSSLAYLP